MEKENIEIHCEHHPTIKEKTGSAIKFEKLCYEFAIKKKIFYNNYKEFNKIITLYFSNPKFIIKPEEITFDEFSEKYLKITQADRGDIDRDSVVPFLLSQDKHFEALTVFSKFRLPPIKYLVIGNVPPNNDDVCCFLRNSIPSRLKHLYFNSMAKENIDCDKYFPYLLCAIETYCFNKGTEVNIYKLNMTAKQLCSLISSAKECEKIDISTCRITSDDEYEFENMEECKIKYIEFRGNRFDKISLFIEYPKRFINFINAIAKCPQLSQSLEIVSVQVKPENYEEAENILKRFDIALE